MVREKSDIKIGFLSPNDRGSYRSSKFVTENLGLCYLWSYLDDKGYKDVTICDARLDQLKPNEALEKLKGKAFDYIGLSVWTREGAEWCAQFVESYLASPQGQRQRPKFILGGYFATLQTELLYEIIPQLDVMVLGEGEAILYEVIEAYEKGQPVAPILGIAYVDEETRVLKTNPRAPLEEDLDKIPLPKRYLAPLMSEDDEVFLEGSRGCPSFCTFCAIRPFAGFKGSPWRYRSARSIVDEIKMLRAESPQLKTFRFIDSDFIGPASHERCLEFAELVKKELPGIRFHVEGRAVAVCKSKEILKALKDAGLYRIYLGIESGSQKILDKMNKRTTVQENLDSINLLKSLGIDCTYGFIMFTPWTTEEDIQENVEFLTKAGNIQINKFFTELLLIPNTPAYKSAKSKMDVTLKENDRTYYTYPSSSVNVERIRAVGNIFEKTDPSFMEKIWYIYRGIRNAIKIGLEEGKKLDQASNKLCISIFKFCWERAQSTQNMGPQEIVNKCVETFKPEVDQLYDILAGKKLIRITSFNTDIHI